MRSIVFTLFIMLLSNTSCTTNIPYEVKSPCVGATPTDSTQLFHYPCVRRPVNSIRDLV